MHACTYATFSFKSDLGAISQKQFRPTYMHTYMHTYIHISCIWFQAKRQRRTAKPIPWHVQTYIFACMQICTYIHACIQTHILPLVPSVTSAPCFRSSCISLIHTCTCIHACMHACIQTHTLPLVSSVTSAPCCRSNSIILTPPKSSS
jgi:hypothetical protein